MTSSPVRRSEVTPRNPWRVGPRVRGGSARTFATRSSHVSPTAPKQRIQLICPHACRHYRNAPHSNRKLPAPPDCHKYIKACMKPSLHHSGSALSLFTQMPDTNSSPSSLLSFQQEWSLAVHQHSYTLSAQMSVSRPSWKKVHRDLACKILHFHQVIVGGEIQPCIGPIPQDRHFVKGCGGLYGWQEHQPPQPSETVGLANDRSCPSIFLIYNIYICV